MANFTTPVGRLLMGSLYKPQTTDAEGKPLVVKSGVNAGQPKVQYFFAVGIPKTGEQHWSQTPWGQLIWAEGHKQLANAGQLPTFAWKVVDGDSAVPNTRGIAPNTRLGYPGHWVISFSSGFAPKIYNKDGTQAIVEPDAVKLGYYVQVNANVDPNGSTQKPGVYINHSMVALSAYGEEIQVGPDASTAGFGAAPLPAGAMAAPAGGFNPAAVAAAPPMAGGTVVGGLQPMGVVAPPAATVAPPPPNPAILAIPAVPATPVMSAKAMGASYAAMLAAGWTHDTLVAHGMLA
jgi:hypothetical protein